MKFLSKIILPYFFVIVFLFGQPNIDIKHNASAYQMHCKCDIFFGSVYAVMGAWMLTDAVRVRSPFLGCFALLPSYLAHNEFQQFPSNFQRTRELFKEIRVRFPDIRTETEKNNSKFYKKIGRDLPRAE